MLCRALPFPPPVGRGLRSWQKTDLMAKRSRLAAIVNTLTDTDLSGLCPHVARSACCKRCGRNRPTPAQRSSA